MKTTLRAVLLVVALTLAACNSGSTNSTPNTISNISGDYTGTVQDSVGGTLAASATLSQHGSAAGGVLTTTSGGVAFNSAITLVITSSNAVSGTVVHDLPNGATCTFSTSGNYNTASQQITASYSAVTGCSGQSGTYTLDQQCTDTVTSVERRPMGVPKC